MTTLQRYHTSIYGVGVDSGMKKDNHINLHDRYLLLKSSYTRDPEKGCISGAVHQNLERAIYIRKLNTFRDLE
jgi:hypothetical protein